MQSYVKPSPTGTTFIGPDATELFRAMTIKSALLMYARHKMQVNRMWTPAVMLQEASRYTGKQYKRGQHAAAAEDVRVWVETMKAAMPVEAA